MFVVRKHISMTVQTLLANVLEYGLHCCSVPVLSIVMESTHVDCSGSLGSRIEVAQLDMLNC